MALKDAETKRVTALALRELETGELRDALARLREAEFRLRFRAATEPIDNPMQFRTIRRNIARIETVLRERTDV